MGKNLFILHFILMVLPFILTAQGCAREHHYTEEEGDALSLFLVKPGAKMVYFASSLDHFQYHPASVTNGSVWRVTVPLKKEFEYFYIVDGEVTLPPCENTVLDDFGAKNCLFMHYNM